MIFPRVALCLPGVFLVVPFLQPKFTILRQKKLDFYGKIGDDITAKQEKDYVIYRSACSRWR